MKEKLYYVYIMSSKSRVLYTGMGNNLHRRVFEHKNDLHEGFTKKYRIHRLVYFASFDDPTNAINREKQIKAWRREKRVQLIESVNPTWEDLAAHWYEGHIYSPDAFNSRSLTAEAVRDDSRKIVAKERANA